MKRYLTTFCFIIAMVFAATPAYSAEESAPSAPGQAHLFEDAEGNTMPYRVFTPEKLEEGKTYPLVLCFHGAAGRGKDNQARGTLAYHVLTSQAVQKKHPAFVVIPQCPKRKRWVNHRWQDGAYDSKKVGISDEMTLALSIVDQLRSELPIDDARIYVTGRSMGGFATWDAIARRPNFFAAAVPIAGGGDPQRAAEWTHLPIWTVASAADRSCPVSGTRVVVEALKEHGGNVKYTEDPKKTHGQICQAWGEMPELVDWLFSQKKQEPKKTESESSDSE